MRLCRYRKDGTIHVGIYEEDAIAPVNEVAQRQAHDTAGHIPLPAGDDLLEFLPPGGNAASAAKQLADWYAQSEERTRQEIAIPRSQVELLVPIPRPSKIFLLAGNYAQHIEEGGGIARQREETFPYVFMKPPTTTLTHPDAPVRIPSLSPNTIDWEAELAVVIGRRTKGVSEADALDGVAGYTIVNDISNRRFRPNANRVAREKDAFFDWLHGKWFDSFCPCGPCITSADAIADPQQLKLSLRVNGELKQDSTTAHQIFPVSAVIAFVSGIVTLEPGDIISTGTPSGVGAASNTFLQPGDVMEATISSIGTLVSPVVAG